MSARLHGWWRISHWICWIWTHVLRSHRRKTMGYIVKYQQIIRHHDFTRWTGSCLRRISAFALFPGERRDSAWCSRLSDQEWNSMFCSHICFQRIGSRRCGEDRENGALTTRGWRRHVWNGFSWSVARLDEWGLKSRNGCMARCRHIHWGQWPAHLLSGCPGMTRLSLASRLWVRNAYPRHRSYKSYVPSCALGLFPNQRIK